MVPAMNDASAQVLGQYGELEGGTVRPGEHMIQIWRQEVYTDEQPAALVLYSTTRGWRRVPLATLRQALSKVAPDAGGTRALAQLDVHAIVHMALQITGGALAFLQAIDAELTATGL